VCLIVFVLSLGNSSEAPSVAEAVEAHSTEQPPVEGVPSSTTAPARYYTHT